MPFPSVTQLFNAVMPQRQPADPSAPPSNATPVVDQSGIPAFDKTQNPNTPQVGPDGKPVVASPMDNFKDLFTLTEEDKKRIADNAQPEKIFSLDPEKLQESVGKMNFVDGQQATQLFQQALKGDANALTSLLNGIAQKVYLQNAQLSATLSERAATTTAENFQKNLPQHFRDFSAGEGLQQLNPAYSHPAFKPVVDGLKQQFLVKYPTASSTEITKMVNSYLDAMGGSRPAPKNDDQGGRGGNDKQVDWQDFFK